MDSAWLNHDESLSLIRVQEWSDGMKFQGRPEGTQRTNHFFDERRRRWLTGVLSWLQFHEIYCIRGHDESVKLSLSCVRRSDTPMQHQSDPRHRSNLIPTGRQNDDTNPVDFAARAPCGRCDRSSLEKQFGDMHKVTQGGLIGTESGDKSQFSVCRIEASIGHTNLTQDTPS